MSPEDVALCQQAIELANSGQTQAAYEQFCAIHNRGNPEDVTLLYWIAVTTPRLEEAQRARDTIARIEPNYPKLQALQAYVAQKQMSSLPPLSPRRKHLWLIVGIVSGVIVLILTGLLIVVLVQQATPRFSKTPLIEPDMYGSYECYVGTKDDPSVLVILTNPNSNTVYRDCMAFMRQAQGADIIAHPQLSPSLKIVFRDNAREMVPITPDGQLQLSPKISLLIRCVIILSK